LCCFVKDKHDETVEDGGGSKSRGKAIEKKPQGRDAYRQKNGPSPLGGIKRKTSLRERGVRLGRKRKKPCRKEGPLLGVSVMVLFNYLSEILLRGGKGGKDGEGLEKKRKPFFFVRMVKLQRFTPRKKGRALLQIESSKTGRRGGEKNMGEKKRPRESCHKLAMKTRRKKMHPKMGKR